MDGLTEGQGSPESPSVVDDITAHINGSNSAEGGNTPESQPAPEASQEGQQPEPQEEPRSRSEERIQQLLAEKQAAEQRAMQLEMFIVSNPKARAAYDEAIHQGFTPEQAAQIATQQPQGQQYQQPQGETQKPWYGDVLPADQLPAWDPYDEDVTREHAKVLINDMVEARVQQAIAPIMQQLQQVVPFVGTLQQQHLTQERNSMITSLDQALFDAVPSAKENQAHFAIANQGVVEGISQLPPEYQNAIRNFDRLHPQDKATVNQVLNTVVIPHAVKRTNELLGQLAPSQPHQSVPKPFAEGGTNLVQARPANEGTDINSMIMAHMSKS